jgi:hypothetical protein
VAEQGCLLSSYTVKNGVGGSNPPLSASRKPAEYSGWQLGRGYGFDRAQKLWRIGD